MSEQNISDLILGVFLIITLIVILAFYYKMQKLKIMKNKPPRKIMGPSFHTSTNRKTVVTVRNPKSDEAETSVGQDNKDSSR